MVSKILSFQQGSGHPPNPLGSYMGGLTVHCIWLQSRVHPAFFQGEKGEGGGGGVVSISSEISHSRQFSCTGIQSTCTYHVQEGKICFSFLHCKGLLLFSIFFV